MPEFLESFDVERHALVSALDDVSTVWDRFRQHDSLEVEGSDVSESLIAGELEQVRAELQSTQFTVGIFGLIKRGKSTLLNALVGREVSAMHVTPETAVPVYVSHSETPGAQVHFADGTSRHLAVEEVTRFTSQKTNAHNHLGVTHVEQRVPVGFLRNGTRLIDTPGLDDADADEVYTARTLQELDVVDAGLVVFLSPPTVSATEMQFLADIVSRDLRKTFLVCNMYPQHFHDPRTRNDVLSYVGGRVLEASRRAGSEGQVRIYPVCALEAWQARLNDDIDQWKRSGADRLLRNMETYLSESAGQEVLDDAAAHISKVATMARGEVQVRRQLLDDPERLTDYRQAVDERVADLERQFDEEVGRAMRAVQPLRMRVRGKALAPFKRARREIGELSSVEGIEEWADRFRRELEVAGEAASREFADGFETIVEDLRDRLQERFQAVMVEITPNLPEIGLSTHSLVVTPDQLQALQRADAARSQSGRTGALAGGVAGGAAALVAGTAMLGPVGLMAGALAGWQLSSVIATGRSLRAARETLLVRLDEISKRLLADLDNQIDDAVEAVRAGVAKQRRAFAGDLYQQFELVQAISSSPRRLERQRRDAERFIQAFDTCAERARRAAER